MWGAVMWTVTWLAVVVFLAIVGVGTWRFIDQAKMYGELRRDSQTLDDDIQDLLDRIEQMKETIPTDCVVDISNLTQPMEYADDEFAIFSGSDNSSGIVFNLLEPGQGVQLSVQNASGGGVIAFLHDVEDDFFFQDATFTIFNAANDSREVMTDLSGISPGALRILTFQDKDGIIAYLSDVPPIVTTFLDDEFVVQHVGDDSKQVMLDCGIIDIGSSEMMTVQDADGIIAYLSDLGNQTTFPFPDDDFFVHADGDPTTRVFLDASVISTATTVVMTVQDRSGTIAYLSQIAQVVEVFISESRVFPDMPNEGVTELWELGNIALLEISLCGAGGSGGPEDDGGMGGGGGSGSGFEDFCVLNAGDRFEYLNVTLGEGGYYTSSSNPEDAVGGSTIVKGFSVTGFFLELIGYGGGGAGGSNQNRGWAGAGGGSAGPGGPPVNSSAGPAEDDHGHSAGVVNFQGGVEGGTAGILPLLVETEVVPGMGRYRFPWRSGGGGAPGEGTNEGTQEPGAPWQGGYAQGGPRAFFPRMIGAASAFGQGAHIDRNRQDASSGFCAGGGPGSWDIPGFPSMWGPNVEGGSGAALMRYHLRPNV
jgi:hypothetical protein